MPDECRLLGAEGGAENLTRATPRSARARSGSKFPKNCRRRLISFLSMSLNRFAGGRHRERWKVEHDRGRSDIVPRRRSPRRKPARRKRPSPPHPFRFCAAPHLVATHWSESEPEVPKRPLHMDPGPSGDHPNELSTRTPGDALATAIGERDEHALPKVQSQAGGALAVGEDRRNSPQMPQRIHDDTDVVSTCAEEPAHRRKRGPRLLQQPPHDRS